MKEDFFNKMKHFLSVYSIPLKISIIYAILGSVWIFFSDQTLEYFIKDDELLHTLANTKKYFYIVMTALLLFIFIARGIISDKKKSRMVLEQNEQALKDSLKELSDVYRALDDSSIIEITDQKGRIKYVNDKFCKVSKYSMEELLGQDNRILNSGKHSKEFFKEMWRTIGKGETWVGEICNKAKDGSFYWLQTTIVPFLNEHGRPYQYVTIRSDITDKKQFDEALKESEERNRKVVEMSPLGIVVHRDGHIVYANKAAIKSMKRDNPIGQPILSYIHSEYHKMAMERIFETSLGTELPFTDMKLVRGDGVVIDAIVGGVSLDFDGKPATMTMFRDVSKRKQIEKKLIESEERYRRLVEFSPEAIIVHIKGIIQYANPSFLKLLGATTLSQVVNKSVLDFVHPQYIKAVQESIDQLTGIGMAVTPTEERLISLDGKMIDVEVTGITLNHERQVGTLIVFHDITRRKKAEEALRQSEEQYRLIADNMNDLVAIIDVNGVVTYASPSHEFVLGFPPNVFEGHVTFEFIHPDDTSEVQHKFKEMVMNKESQVAEFRYRHSKGHWLWMEAYGKPVVDDQGTVIYSQIVARDITERKMFEEKLSHMAYHDTLTNLPNRRMFQERLEQAIKGAERYQRKFTIMYMDLDKFKKINDTLGHDVGDQLLIQFSERVLSCLRDCDTLARQGGDEFTILLSEIKEENDAILIAERILTTIQLPWNIGNQEFTTTSSIGISFYPKDGTSAGELMKKADSALYEAKEDGRNNIKTFTR